MDLATVVHRFRATLVQHYGPRLLPGHHRALDAIETCRTSGAGELLWHCTGCNTYQWRARSCGHRSCPRCQNHEASVWLERQRAKLLPVDYFLVTFTLPAELRSLAWSHQRTVYNILFSVATETLQSFGQNPKHLGARLGMTAVLHTHSRRLDYHPHVHVLVPGGGIDTRHACWRRTRYQYLFNAFALATVFRAKCLQAIVDAALPLPSTLPDKWVVDCRRVGRGEPALKYLSRYLYRGVIGEQQIAAGPGDQVRFCFTDGQTGKTQTRTLAGADFLWQVLQHVLPRGFHRVRDYGFLHHNAKRLLQRLQYLLHVVHTTKPVAERPCFQCPCCGQAMTVISVRSAAEASVRKALEANVYIGPPLLLSG